VPSRRRERRQRIGPAIGAAAALLALVAVAAAFLLTRKEPELASSPAPSIIVGTPGGEVIAEATPTQPTPETPVSPEPTAEPQATEVPTEPPPPPSATPSPAPVAVAPQPAPTATAGTTVVAAHAQPDDAVAAFYAHVVAGRFEQAYNLWSPRMQAIYPRAENLDGRFDETASIEFRQLFVAEQTPTTATVQADFVETNDAGDSREFIGYWRLVLVGGRWLLDAPTY
jgi:type IV secretory pathway VirB10-like protein